MTILNAFRVAVNAIIKLNPILAECSQDIGEGGVVVEINLLNSDRVHW